jgi:hypothetical protein
MYIYNLIAEVPKPGAGRKYKKRGIPIITSLPL